ncbi:MAG: hypothetical protein GQ582_13295 [Methyloprofundus sp.]|nr:hypothetical protein [Methyloprofundus sp.]
MDSLEEINHTLQQLQQLFRDLTVGGLLTAGSDKVNTLKTLHKEFARIGASHIAEQLEKLLLAIEHNSQESAVLLMRAQASVQLFARILSLQYAANSLQEDYLEKATSPLKTNTPDMKLPCKEPALIKLLEDLCHSVEDIVLTGMTTANQATCDSLQLAFKEASQIRLLRLGSTLRVAVEEINRFNQGQAEFSAKRLNFFLNRAWMISHGLKLAVQKKDHHHWNTLNTSPTGVAVAKLDVVTIGVSKKVVKDAFCVFEFRLRTVTERLVNGNTLAAGTAMIWSTVFPLKKGTEIDPEAFLHLAQKQKFRPIDLISNKISTFENIILIGDRPPFRLSLNDESRVLEQEKEKDKKQRYTKWLSLAEWDRESAYQKAQAHSPSPFELDIELQEEVFLHDWSIIEKTRNKTDQLLCYSIESGGLYFQAQVALDDKVTQKALVKASKATDKAILFGLMHYESCQLVLQVLSLITTAQPVQLMLSNEKKGAASILRSMRF